MTSKFTKVLVAGVCALAISACSQEAAKTSLVGQQVGDFQLTDQDGVAQTMKYDLDAPAVVLVAHLNNDEGSRAAADKLAELQAKYPSANFMMINSGPNDGRAEIVAETQAHTYTVPVLDDDMQLIGEDLGFTYAGEAVALNPKTGVIAYHGPVDSLDAALASMTTGQPVEVAEVSGKGTMIEFTDRGQEAQFANISYAEEVAPILAENCAACHAPGGIAPWAMTDFETVKGFAPMIREAIRTDRMPPYNADPHIGEFQDYANLSVEDAKTLVHWIEAGAPRGEGDDPLKTLVHEVPDWPMGEPDLVVDVPEYELPATGIVDYQMPAIPYPETEGKWLGATAFKAGSRQGVHHILAGWIPKMPENGNGGFDWELSMGGYAVGREVNLAPENWGTYIPPGGAVALQMHYTPFGKAMTDRSKVGFYFLDEEPEKVMRQIVAVDPTITIEPNESRHHERAYIQFPAAVQIYGAQPHAHYRGYSSKLTARYPDGREEVILNLPKYDFGYQQEYVFKELVDLPAGSILIADYLYDNSKNNPANPDPNERIVWGDQSFEEMLFTAIRFRWVDETSDNRRDDLQAQLNAQTLFTAVDDNIDGKWQEAELRLNSGQGLADMMKGMKQNFAALDTDSDGGLNPQEVQAAMEHMQRQMREERAARRTAAGGQD